MANTLLALDLKTTFFGNNPIAQGSYLDQPTTFISKILPNAYVFASFLLFIYLVVGGFMLITAGADAKQADTGKQALTNAIIGFVLIFTSYWLIQIIEIITGIPIF